jgi:hypothetical protein
MAFFCAFDDDIEVTFHPFVIDRSLTRRACSSGIADNLTGVSEGSVVARHCTHVCLLAK